MPAKRVMLTDMQLLWVQYWTALPVIVEDRDMTDESQAGGRMPLGAFPIDTSGQYRPGDSEGNTRTATRQHPNALSDLLQIITILS